METNINKGNSLHSVAQFSLFITSYLPLFLLIIVHQLFQNYDYLKWGGLNLAAVNTFILKFGLSYFLLVIAFFGLYGFRHTFKNLNEVSVNGFPVVIKDVRNLNSESIGYIATYIIPFLFQDFNSLYECLSVLFLLVIIYRIYINSTLLLVNPVLSIWYSIYEIEFDENGLKRNGLIISRDRYLQEEDKIKIYAIGHKLYFATIEE